MMYKYFCWLVTDISINVYLPKMIIDKINSVIINNFCMYHSLVCFFFLKPSLAC